MVRIARFILLPLLLANITIAANNWRVLGVDIGEALFWVIIALAAYLVWHSPYRTLGLAALVAALLLRLAEAATHLAAVEAVRQACLPLLMMTAGASAYARHPRLLARQFLVFLALCLPIMALQITGATPAVMTWDVDYAHDPAILAPEEIGTFKRIPVYPTLFVSIDDLHYEIGQGRPSGLLYANNVLSVFVVIAAGLALAVARPGRVGVSGLVVAATLVLTMSLTAFLAVAVLYAVVLVLGDRRRRWYVLKMILVSELLVWAYKTLFPGLLAGNFSNEKMMVRLYTRGLGLLDVFGIDFLRRSYEYSGAYTWGIIEPDTTYSGIERLLRSPFVAVFAIVAVLALIWYARALVRLRRGGARLWPIYPITALMCVLTQFGVPYYGAPSFQCIFGFAMFPILQQIWPLRTRPARGVAAVAPATS